MYSLGRELAKIETLEREFGISAVRIKFYFDFYYHFNFSDHLPSWLVCSFARPVVRAQNPNHKLFRFKL